MSEQERVPGGGLGLLLIDFQNDIAGDGSGGLHPWADGPVRTAAVAATWARSNRVPVIWVRVERLPGNRDAPRADTDAGRRRTQPDRPRLVAGTPGAELVAPLSRQDGDIDIVKRRVSAFYATPLEVYLRALGVRLLLVGGIFTNVGVETTVRDAYDRDVDVIVVSDACASYSEEAHRYAVESVLPRFSRVLPWAEVPVDGGVRDGLLR
ncbi:MAG: isochorismatase family protein [Micromonosporaceae bacterium]|nr:isochorismatase family protein [Micromonosporaceae bacterium]